jgi:hypothetical protein
MSLADVKEVLRVGKVGAPKSWLHTCAQLEHWTVVMALLLGAGHESVAWLLSLARLARAKALVFDRQASADPQLPLAVLARIHLTFHAFFESVQGGGPALLPDLASIIRELRERRLACPRLPPAMQRLLGGPNPNAGGGGGGGGGGGRGSTAAVNPAPSARLQIGPGRNLGACIRTAASAGDGIPLTDDGRLCPGARSRDYTRGRSAGWTRPRQGRRQLLHRPQHQRPGSNLGRHQHRRRRRPTRGPGASGRSVMAGERPHLLPVPLRLPRPALQRQGPSRQPGNAPPHRAVLLLLVSREVARSPGPGPGHLLSPHEPPPRGGVWMHRSCPLYPPTTTSPRPTRACLSTPSSKPPRPERASVVAFHRYLLRALRECDCPRQRLSSL